MTVYVDTLLFRWRGRRWGHLFTDGPIEELHAFAARLGLKRAWFQAPPRATWPHYDITAEQRLHAIYLGAAIADRVTTVRLAAGERAARRLARQLARDAAGGRP